MSSMVYEFGEYRLEAGRRTLLDSDGQPVAVTAKAFDALSCLVERHGELVEREALQAALWPNVVVEDNNLNQAIGALRRILGDGYVATAFRNVRRLPGFNQLMREEGFLDYWLAYGWPDFCRPLENDDFECF